MSDGASPPAESPGRERGLPLGRLIAFAAPAAPISAIDTPISVYLPAFYGGLGLSLGLVGAAFFIGRIAEIPLALSAGAVSDRFGWAKHRRKFWLAAAAPFGMAAIWAVFAPPDNPSGGYLIGWLLAAVAALTLLSINHVAWGSEATARYHERTRIQASRQIASVAGLVLVLAAPILIERAHPGGADRLRMAAIGGFFVLLLPLTVAAAALLAPERPSPRPAVTRTSLKAAFAALQGDRALRRLLLVDLCDAGALGIVTSLFVFLARDVWGLGRISSLLLLAYVLSGVVFLGPILKAAGGRTKPRTMAWIALGLTLALPAILLVPAGGVAAAVLCVVLLGAPSATNTALLDSMMGDIAAEDAARRGEVRTGLYYALHLIMGRVGRGVAIAVAFALLDRIGFGPNRANAPAAVNAFKLIYVGAPVALQLAIARLTWTFPVPEPVVPGVRRQAQPGAAAG
ncbi:MFS transporter [Phenylobacterium sp.]|uniref:MFS transporter n=1 Tax=Phenylobacterium sp. TaxID=1871053 RepID=UPI002BDFBF65|nr:MFS transporter [Phenylobacterium sp.]HLZ77523.1 MFS transporter [Phenylobacterium sp.]